MLLRVWCLLTAAALLPAWAGEYALLTSGLRIHADRHEASGGVIRLFQKDGVTELPAVMVARFEEDDFIPPASPPAPAPPAPVSKPAPTAPLDAAPVPSDPHVLLRDAAVRSGLPPAFVASVAKVESAFRSDAVSPKGALGVMQLMPQTAEGLGADPRDPAQNIDAGTRLLRELLVKYGGDVVKALAAYNAGPGAVDRFGGLPPYEETRHYVNRVIGAYQQAGGR
jgi:soluble lytic murein transglycosylase-like protein